MFVFYTRLTLITLLIIDEYLQLLLVLTEAAFDTEVCPSCLFPHLVPPFSPPPDPPGY